MHICNELFNLTTTLLEIYTTRIILMLTKNNHIYVYVESIFND